MFGLGTNKSRNLRKLFLADFDNLCLLDKAKKVASNVLLFMLVPSHTGSSLSLSSLSLEDPLWGPVSDVVE